MTPDDSDVLARRFKRELDIATHRRPSGYPTQCVFEDVRVSCRVCGGVTVFPMLIDGGRRPTPAPCLHCGSEI